MDYFDCKLVKMLYEDNVLSNVAKNLYVSQPALTKRLANIEKEFNENMFIRGSKGITFTEYGMLLYEYCVKTVENREHLVRKINNLNHSHYTLKIGSSPAFALHELPNLISEFCAEHKNLDVIIDSKTSYDSYIDLKNRVINISFLRDSYTWEGKKIKIFEEPVYIISKEKISKKDLASYPLITYAAAPSLENLMYKWLEENGMSKETAAFKISDASLTLKMVEKGIGWSIMSDLHLKNYSGYKEKMSFKDEDYTYKTYFYYSLDCKKDIFANKFIEFVKEYYNI